MLVRAGNVAAGEQLAGFVIERHHLMNAGETEVPGASADLAGFLAAVLGQDLAAGACQFNGLAGRKPQALRLIGRAGPHDLAGRARNTQESLGHYGLDAASRIAGTADRLDPLRQGKLHAIDRNANVGQDLVARRIADDLGGSRIGDVGRIDDVGSAADDRPEGGCEVGLRRGIELELVNAVEPEVDAALERLHAAGEGIVP